MVSEGYKEKVDAAWKEIKPAFEEKLKEIAKVAGVTIEIADTSDEEYEMEMALSAVEKNGDISFVDYGKGKFDEGDIAIRATLVEEVAREGDEDDPGEEGLAISISCIGYGGYILPDYTPYNYTNSLFTNDVDVLKGRIEDLDAEESVDALKKDVRRMFQYQKKEKKEKKCKQ